MFRFASNRLFQTYNNLPSTIRNHFTSSCESTSDSDSEKNSLGSLGNDGVEDVEFNSILAGADALEAEQTALKRPKTMDYFRGLPMGVKANTFDGFRFMLQKQVNLNTVVLHHFEFSQHMPAAYQYRLILPYDEAMVNVSSDLDFNTTAEVSGPVPFISNTTAKGTFVLSDMNKVSSIEVENSDDTSVTKMTASLYDGVVEISRMQSVTPTIQMGGAGQYDIKSGGLTTSLCGLYENDENVLAAQWDGSILLHYERKINPNRVHLKTNLLVDQQGKTSSALGAEYTLKQSKINLSVDSNLQFRTSVETALQPGVQLQLCAEMDHFGNNEMGSYKFGYGITMG